VSSVQRVKKISSLAAGSSVLFVVFEHSIVREMRTEQAVSSFAKGDRNICGRKIKTAVGQLQPRAKN